MNDLAAITKLFLDTERQQNRERAISDFWEAEAARGRAHMTASGSDGHLWARWSGQTGIPGGPYEIDGDNLPWSVPRVAWWHAHRRTR